MNNFLGGKRKHLTRNMILVYNDSKGQDTVVQWILDVPGENLRLQSLLQQQKVPDPPVNNENQQTVHYVETYGASGSFTSNNLILLPGKSARKQELYPLSITDNWNIAWLARDQEMH